MAIFTGAISILTSIVTVIGGGMVILGGIQLFQGQGDNNAAAKQTGLSLIIAGGGIVLLAQTLIPMLTKI